MYLLREKNLLWILNLKLEKLFLVVLEKVYILEIIYPTTDFITSTTFFECLLTYFYQIARDAFNSQQESV